MSMKEEDEAYPGELDSEEMSAEEAAYYAQLEAQCGAPFVTGGSDPYSTSCDNMNGPSHHPATKHSAPHPLAMGDDESRVEWNGGGSCAGDPLPYRDVEWLTDAEVKVLRAEADWEERTRRLNV